jgi:hypothetical protein
MPIVGRHTVELYCDVEHAAGATLLEVTAAVFSGRRRGDALRAARRAGWDVNEVWGRADRPACSGREEE